MIFTIFSCKYTVNRKNYIKICVINFTVSRKKKNKNKKQKQNKNKQKTKQNKTKQNKTKTKKKKKNPKNGNILQCTYKVWSLYHV